MTEANHQYSRSNPFMASIKQRYVLCKPASSKSTQHIVLDLEGSGITYNVGDSIAIFPKNDPDLIEMTLKAMKATGQETVLDKHAEHQWNLREFLTSKANISEVSKKLLSEIGFREKNVERKSFIQSLFEESRKEDLKDYLEKHHLWDILQAHPDVWFPYQELCNLLMPLLPRFYSIASSQREVGNEIHLTVAYLKYKSNGYERRGVCTHYLCHLAPMHESSVGIYIQPNHSFTLPADPNIPIIMVGPGTGVAPFRAFMQERIASGSPGKNWLFFGERHSASDYFYQDFWDSLTAQGKLRINVAFSRDQDYKIYVQHRMLEHGKELFEWLQHGAFFYVCGDAKQMARDVEAALLQIIQEHGKMTEADAKLYLKKMRTDKRYLRDIY